MNAPIANWLILIGLFLLIAGILARTGLFSWFGNLPGDFHIKREGFQFYLPLGSMLVISIALSALLSLIRKFL